MIPEPDRIKASAACEFLTLPEAMQRIAELEKEIAALKAEIAYRKQDLG